MVKLGNIMKQIARRNANKYDKMFRKAMYEQNLCILAAFDSYCVDNGITLRQQEQILNGVLFDVTGYCGERDLENVIERRRWNYTMD